MKKALRTAVSNLVVLLLTASLILPAYASHSDSQTDLEPKYATYIDTYCTADISDSLRLSTYASYAVTSEVTRVDITTFVEKRNLLVRWDRVDIGQPNNEWTDIRYGATNSVSHSKQLSSSGTYRVTVVFEVYNGTTLIETVEERSGNITC